MFAEKGNNKEGKKDETTIEGKIEYDKEQAGKHIKKNKKRKAKLSESEHDDTKVKNKKSKRKRDDSCGDGSFADISQCTDTADEQKSKRNIEKENCREIGHEKAKGKKEQDSELSGSDNTFEGNRSNKRKRRRSEAGDDDDTSNKKNKQHQECDDEDTSRKNSEEASAHDGANELETDDNEKKKKKRKRKKKENQETEVPQLRVISKYVVFLKGGVHLQF